MKLKKASYTQGIHWIAFNDNAGAGDTEEAITGYISVVLLADLFGTTPERVAKRVISLRKKHGLPFTY